MSDNDMLARERRYEVYRAAVLIFSSNDGDHDPEHAVNDAERILDIIEKRHP